MRGGAAGQRGESEMAVEIVERESGELVLRFRGEFSAQDARDIHRAMAGARRTGAVTLDFSRVQRFEDFAVALVAPYLVATGGRRVRVVGLGQHQRRILEYFGVPGMALADRPGFGDDDQPLAHA